MMTRSGSSLEAGRLLPLHALPHGRQSIFRARFTWAGRGVGSSVSSNLD